MQLITRHKSTTTTTSVRRICFYIGVGYSRLKSGGGSGLRDRISRPRGFVYDGHDLALKPFDRLQTRNTSRQRWRREMPTSRRCCGFTSYRGNNDGFSEVYISVYKYYIHREKNGVWAQEHYTETFLLDMLDHQQSSRTSVSFVVRSHRCIGRRGSIRILCIHI